MVACGHEEGKSYPVVWLWKSFLQNDKLMINFLPNSECSTAGGRNIIPKIIIQRS
jgi:hypothetical protein